MASHICDLWSSRLGTASAIALRRLAVAANTVSGVVITAAPYLSPRPEHERTLYAVVGAVLVANAALLLGSRRWPGWLVAGMGIAVPNIGILALVARSSHADILPMLLIWSALATPYFRSRAAAALNLLVIVVGLGAAVGASPDDRMSVFVWVVTVLVCVACTIAVRLMAEKGDALVAGLEQRARQDPVTGLLNRRGFDERLGELWDSPSEPDLAVVFFDLDHFKMVNDTYGHEAGDAALRAFAEVLGANVRDGDVAARTGGEEFGVVLPARSAAAALERAQAVIDAFAGRRIHHAGRVMRCRASGGVAVRGDIHQTPSHLCRDADRALYAAKDAGRDQAVLWGSGPGQLPGPVPAQSAGAHEPAAGRLSVSAQAG